MFACFSFPTAGLYDAYRIVTFVRVNRWNVVVRKCWIRLAGGSSGYMLHMLFSWLFSSFAVHVYLRASYEYFYGSTRSHVRLKTIHYSTKCVWLFGCLTHRDTSYSTQMAKRRPENLEWEGISGSPTSATIAATSDWTLNFGCCYAVSNQYEFSTSRALHPWSKQRTFPI